MRVIHRGTDLRAFSGSSVEPERVERLRKAWGIEPHRRVVLLAARLTDWKGQKVLIEAARKLVDQGHDDIAVVLAGDPQGRDDYVRELDALVETLKLGAIVHRVGHCTDMPAAFLTASVVDRALHRAGGLRALGCRGAGDGRADRGVRPRRGARDVLAPPDVSAGSGRDGACRPGDAAALAEAISAALSLGASARDALARRARDHVEAHFSLERMVGETLDLYGAMLTRED